MPRRRTRQRSCRRSRACTTQRAVEVTDAAHLLEPIRALHERIRDAVVAACRRQTSELLAAVASDAEGDGDTIYAIDRVGEDMLVQGLADVAREEPLCLIAEGLPGDGLVLPRGAREQDCRWRLLVDPIDGTRGLMYQKRSAWILTGVAPNRGAGTRLRDIVLAGPGGLLRRSVRVDRRRAVRADGGSRPPGRGPAPLDAAGPRRPGVACRAVLPPLRSLHGARRRGSGRRVAGPRWRANRCAVRC